MVDAVLRLLFNLMMETLACRISNVSRVLSHGTSCWVSRAFQSNSRFLLSSKMERNSTSQNSSSSSKNAAAGKATASIIVIGDEILKGHTKDTNSGFLLSRLWSIGVNVQRVSFLPDSVEEVAAEVRKFSKSYSLVFTTGGIGPTHDDITLNAIARAFDECLVENKQLTEILKDLLKVAKLSETPALLKMAMLPISAKLVIGTDPLSLEPVPYPLVSCHNIYVLPGVPEYLEKAFKATEHIFSLQGSTFYLTKVYLSADETFIAAGINRINEHYKGIVHIGSYPILSDVYRTKITLESVDKFVLESAYKELVAIMPQDSAISVEKCLPNMRDGHYEVFHTTSKAKVKKAVATSKFVKPLSLAELNHYLHADNRSRLSTSLKCAWGVLGQALAMYGTDEVCIAFNGGKDCTAVLHLWSACLRKMFPEGSFKLLALYLQTVDPFPEAHDFIEDCRLSYNLEMIVIPGSIRDGLEKLKISHPKIKAVIMGTRRHDPYSAKLRSFTPTDSDWPHYMRVFPILDWSYAEVWDFLRTFDLSYCRLYDEGYTSLGGKHSTSRNPELLLPDGRYSPAYVLTDGDRERTGRRQ